MAPPIVIRRETDASLINAHANGPDVAPFVNYGVGAMDFAPALAPDANVIFLSNGRDAVAAFERTAPRRWQSHTLFGPTCRGRAAIDTGRAMVAWMLDRCTVGAGATVTPIGSLPRPTDLNMNGLDVTSESLAALFSVDPALWRKEVTEIGDYFARYGARLPAELQQELAVTQQLLG